MTSRPDSVDRRSFIAASGAACLGLPALAGSSHFEPAPQAPPVPPVPPVPPGRPVAGRRRSLRFAHLTDIHVQPERGAADGMAAALRDAQTLEDPVELIVTGGDAIMDAFEATEARTREQWELFDRVLAEHCRVPIRHCIGNHDIWGWKKQESRTRGDEPRWGKAWARERFGLAEDHYAFEHGGWKFLMLDSVRSIGDGYTGYLQPEQRTWLEKELEGTPATVPVVIVSHIPLLTVTVMAGDARRSKDLAVSVPGNLMHSDVAAICAILTRFPNVRLCLSGHMHQIDRIDWRGITFICDGAVSGAWWKGPNGSTPEGYGLIDLYDDGTFDWGYRTYGWTARA